MLIDIERIKIGTRGSPLALWQANWVKSQLKDLHEGLEVELVTIQTSGDKIQDVPLAKIGGKGLFLKEIEDALLRRDIDIAVHSMKDVPVMLPNRLCIAAVTKRENPCDAFISKDGAQLVDLPENARIGTSSLRRQTQLLNFRPDFQIVPLRGNVGTRLRKLESEELDGIVLAAAGLKRLGWEDRITEYVNTEILLPAIGQGAVGIEARYIDVDILSLLVDLDHEETHRALEAERSFLKALEGGCQVPIGAYAKLESEELTIQGLVGSLDGRQIFKGQKRGSIKDAVRLGASLANDILAMGADKILREFYED